MSDKLFKHYELDSSEVEKLIEMWKFFHSNDDPYPVNNHVIYVNKKNPEVSPLQLLHVVKHDVYELYMVRLDRLLCRSFHVCTIKPVGYMYDYFLEKFKGQKPISGETQMETYTQVSDNKPKRKKKDD